jgi:D-alanine-D-alanine ligase
VESFVDGREFNVAVMENSGLQALPVSEISFSGLPDSRSRICGYEAKWFEDHILYQNTQPLCPAPISAELERKLQGMALEAFRATGCRDYARVDFRMDKNDQCFILEVNPNPDISLNAGFARALAAEGIPYDTFWSRLIKNTLKRMGTV